MDHSTADRAIVDAASRPRCGKTRQTMRRIGAVLLAGGLAAGSALGQVHAATPVAAATAHGLSARLTLGGARPSAFAAIGQTMPLTSTIASTVPANGDVNPYGVAVAPQTMGKLLRGHLLISNFNSQSAAGRGNTIVQIGPDDGTQRLFARLNPRQLAGRCPGVGQGGVGLTTALAILKRGYVVVGSLPTRDGKPQTAAPGCLLVLDAEGSLVRTIVAPDIQGPWDLTALDQGSTATLFVTNVLDGSRASLAHGNDGGTVVRLGLSLPYPGQGIPRVVSNTVIASGFEERTDPAALALGPTGLGLGRDGTLYVADTLENRIAAIPNALTRQDSAYTGRDLTAGGDLNGPLGLTILPNGDILTANGNDGKMVRTTPDGTQAKAVLVDGTLSQGNPPGAGALFGLAVSLGGHQIYFGDDATNTLNRVAVAETM